MMRTMLALRLSGYGRETKRPAIGYGQRPENSQRAEVWADGKTKGFIKTKSLGRRYGRMGGRRVRVRGECGFSSLLKQKIKTKNKKNLLRHLQRRNFFFKILML